MKKITMFFATPLLGILTILFWLPSIVMGQEICNNGLDDDNDGFIDCYDADCSGNVNCAGSSYGQSAGCQYVPTPGGFSMQSEWKTDPVFDFFSTVAPVAGDWDNDGVVEVFAYNHNGQIAPNGGPGAKIYVINGNSGAVEDSIVMPISAPQFQTSGMALGDLNNDGFAELVIMGIDSRLRCYNHLTSLLWTSVALSPALTPSPGIADFNQDGNPEVYCSAFVFNGQTGVQIGMGAFPPTGAVGAPIVGGGLTSLGMSVAADVLPDSFCTDCAGLELIAGNKVFSVNTTSGQVTVINTAASPGFDGFTAIADYDADGDLDGIISTDGAGPGQTFVFVWDLQTPAVIAVSPIFSGSTFWTIGQANVGDFDGDGRLEVAVATQYGFHVLDDYTTGLALKWTKLTTDDSGFTSSIHFDFKGDGVPELVYQDEDSIYVYDGNNGNLLLSRRCRGGTIANHPIVVDVDGDDQAEIICGCSDGIGVNPRLHGFIESFGPALGPWIDARAVWNQQSYWVTNVNDDLSIPVQQQNHHILGDSVILNGFHTQTTILQANGTPLFAAPDASSAITNVDLTNCGNGPNTIDVTIQVKNLSADAALPSQNPVALYNGNPALPGAILIDTMRIPSIVPVLDSSMVTLTIPDQGGNFSLFVVANDTGHLVTPTAFLSTTVGECNFSNNFDSLQIQNCTVTSFCNAGVLTASPAGQAGCPGFSVTFSADTVGGGFADSLRWHASTNGGSSWMPLADQPPYSGTATLSLSISSATVNMDDFQYLMVAYYCGATETDSSGSAVLIVGDTIPPIALCQNISIYLGPSGNATITTSDIDNGSTDNCSWSNTSLDVSTFNCANVGSNPVTLSVVDSSGNIATCTSTVMVIDSVAPTAVCQNLTIFLNGSGNAIINPADIDNGSSDNCAVSSSSLDVSLFTCSDLGVNAVTFGLADGSGNTDSCSAMVTVVDSISPNPVCQNISVYLDGGGNATITTGDIDNGSSDNCSVSSFALDLTAFTCSDVGVNTVILTATDPSNNTGVCSAAITVIDSIAPTAVCQNISVYLDASGNASITPSDIENGSFGNCSVSSSTIDFSVFTCTNIGVNTVTLTIVDGNNNSSNCISAVTVIDSIAPLAVCQNISAYLDGSGNATITTGDIDNGSSDNCSVSSSLDITSFTCAEVGPNTVTLTAVDASTNSTTCTSSVTVVDSIVPTAACQSISVYLDGNGNAGITTGDVDNGSSDNCSVSSSTLDLNTFTCSDVGGNVVTLTVTDPSNNTATCSTSIMVLDSTAPTAVCQSISVYLDASGNASITAGDIDNGSSGNCSVSSSTIDINAFTCANIGVNTVTLTLVDGNTNSSSCNAAVTVIDSIAPAAVCQNISAYLDGSGNATITTGDIDSGSSDNCSVSSSLDIASFTCAEVGINMVTLTAVDASANSTTCTSSVTVIDSIVPTAVCQNLSIYLDTIGNASILSSDVDNGSSDNCALSGIGLDVNAFSCADLGLNAVTLTATDFGFNAATCSAGITVIDTTAPTAVCQSLSVCLDASGNASIAPSDIDNGSYDNCSVSSSIIDVSAFTCSDIGTNAVTLTLVDGNTNSSSCTSSVTVVDTIAPTATCQNLTAYLDGTGSATISPADLTASTSDNCAVTGSGLDIATFGCADLGANTVTLTVTDANNNAGTCQATISVLDSIAPTAICMGTPVFLDANGLANVTAADIDNSSTDNCGISSLSLSTTSFACANIGGNSVTLTVTDGSGNLDNCQTVLQVVDTIAPAAICTPLTVYLDIIGNKTIAASDVDGGSTDNCGIVTLSLSNVFYSCADLGSNTVTLTAVDGSGNADSCTTNVTVTDTIAPMVICLSDTVYLGTNGQVTITAASLDGGSTDECGIASLSLSQTVFVGANVGVNQVILTATDGSGNSADCISTVTVLDTLMSGIDEGLAGASFAMDVFPNPTFDNLNVKVTCEDCWNVDGITLRLVNVTGQVVFEREIEVTAGGFSTRVDLSQLASGPYMLSMEREGERITRRVVKL